MAPYPAAADLPPTAPTGPGTELEPVETVTAELLPQAHQAEVEVADPVTAAVLDALNQEAKKYEKDNRPKKTTSGYERDWALWEEFHHWLAVSTGHLLPLTSITSGTLVAFVRWLDGIKLAAPNTIERRITGVTVEGRDHGAIVTKEATLAARKALKHYKLDPIRQARGRGQAPALNPGQIRAMNTAPLTKTTVTAAAETREHTISELARLRDRSINTMSFAVAGRSAEVSALNDRPDKLGIAPVAEGLMVHVPSVKGRPARDVAVAYGKHPDSCPVRCWLAWQQAKHAAGAVGGAAYPHIDQYGNVRPGTRLSADGIRDAQSRAGEQAGLPIHVTGHSYRRGLINTGRKAGKRAEKLRQQSGHSKKSPVFWDYVEEGEVWEDAATEGIGL